MNKNILLVATLLALVGASGIDATASAATGVNDFEITKYDIDYYLDQDSDKRSTLRTVESITAQFPTLDQNHGIERAIPRSYDGHTTDISHVTVKDTGGVLPFTQRTSNGNTVLRIGNANRYVHGAHNYQLDYTQRDVTKYFEDTNDDEFYWDTNGIEWAVPIKQLTATIHIAEPLRKALNAHQTCYLGSAGSTAPCQITATDDGFRIAATGLRPNQNATIAVGFHPHTFAAFKLSPMQFFLKIVLIALLFATFGIAVMLFIWFMVRYNRRSNRTAEITTIIPEYLPPTGTSVSVAGAMIGKPEKSFSAQLIDLAIRQYIRIYQTRPKSFFRQAHYEIEVLRKITDLKAEEQDVLRDLFGDPYVGARLDMASLKNNRTVSRKLADNKKKLTKNITGQYGLRAHDKTQSTWFKRRGFIMLGLAVLTFSPWLIIAAITAFVCGATLKPLTDKGLVLVRYLKGLELYIKTAETERLRILQSPDGAEKIGAPIDTNDTRQVVKLYERVLPYAMLFGLEKEWNNRLGQYYEMLDESPDWFVGHNNAAFNAAAFGSAINSFSTAASYSDPSSSSSGGSGGGGSSGGGGGGGGGGGW